MDNKDWVEEAIKAWEAEDVNLLPGVTLEELRDYEKVLGFSFPQEFNTLYQKMNGFELMDYSMFCLWPLEKIWEEYSEGDERDFIAVCDYLINSHTIGFYKPDGCLYKSYDRAEPVSCSYRQLIEMVRKEDGRLF